NAGFGGGDGHPGWRHGGWSVGFHLPPLFTSQLTGKFGLLCRVARCKPREPIDQQATPADASSGPVQPRKLSLPDVDKLVDDARTSGQKPYLARPGGVVLK